MGWWVWAWSMGQDPWIIGLSIQLKWVRISSSPFFFSNVFFSLSPPFFNSLLLSQSPENTPILLDFSFFSRFETSFSKDSNTNALTSTTT
jgi:hypothetical protein